MTKLASKTKLLVAFSVLAMIVTATAMARSGKQDFVLHNETGVEIHELYDVPDDDRRLGRRACRAWTPCPLVTA